MLASVALCSLKEKNQDESVYVNDLVGIIQGKVSFHTYAESLKDKTLKNDLNEVIDYREKIRKN